MKRPEKRILNTEAENNPSEVRENKLPHVSGGLSGVRPVFIHTGFRSGSTWFWRSFRNNINTVSYYEYFNEGLSHFSALDLEANKPGSWDSRHPDTSPYFLEYLPFLKPSGGVEGFNRSMSLDEFMPADGLFGTLPRQEIEYISQLIGAAQAVQRTPVLSETRTLARIAGLRQAFGGTHLLLHRNLFQQWSSYCYLHDKGNTYFFSALLHCLLKGKSDPYFVKLEEYGKRQIREDPENISADEWLSRIDPDSLFVLFAGFHVYLLMHALNQVDIVVDITKLARNGPDARQNLQLAIWQATGLSIDLSDVTDSLQTPAFPLKTPTSTRKTLDSFFRLAVHLCESDPRQVEFGEDILSSLWQEYDRYTFYTQSLVSLLAKKSDELDAARRQHEEEARTRIGVEHALAQANGESMSAREALEALREAHASEVLELRSVSDTEADRLRSEIVSREEVVTSLSAEIERLRRELSDIRSSRAAETSGFRDAIALEGKRADTHLEMTKQLRDELDSLRSNHAGEIAKLRENYASEAAHLRNALEQRDRDSADLVATIVRLNGELIGLQTKHASDIVELQNARAAEALHLREALAQQERDNAELLETIGRLNGEIQERQNSHDEQIAELQKFGAAEAIKSREVLAQQERDAAELSATVIKLRGELKDLLATHSLEITELRRISAAETQELREILAQRDRDAAELMVRIDTLHNELEQMELARTDEMDKFRRLSEADIGQLRSSMIEKERHSAALSEERDHLTRKIEEVLKRLGATEIERDASQREVTYFRRIIPPIIEFAGGAAVLASSTLSNAGMFDDVRYRAEYPDVDQAVKSGGYLSGLEHWLIHGIRENRSLFVLNAPDLPVEK